jgi:hypothetical protein
MFLGESYQEPLRGAKGAPAGGACVGESARKLWCTSWEINLVKSAIAAHRAPASQEEPVHP